MRRREGRLSGEQPGVLTRKEISISSHKGKEGMVDCGRVVSGLEIRVFMAGRYLTQAVHKSMRYLEWYCGEFTAPICFPLIHLGRADFRSVTSISTFGVLYSQCEAIICSMTISFSLKTMFIFVSGLKSSLGSAQVPEGARLIKLGFRILLKESNLRLIDY
jgi:hypothetical protein